MTRQKNVICKSFESILKSHWARKLSRNPFLNVLMFRKLWFEFVNKHQTSILRVFLSLALTSLPTSKIINRHLDLSRLKSWLWNEFQFKINMIKSHAITQWMFIVYIYLSRFNGNMLQKIMWWVMDMNSSVLHHLIQMQFVFNTISWWWMSQISNSSFFTNKILKFFLFCVSDVISRAICRSNRLYRTNDAACDLL
jgi:hypothetical protein